MQTLRKRGPSPGTGDFIRNYLQKVGSDYANNIYRCFCKELKSLGQQCPSYASFAKYMGVCAQMDLIEFVREEPLPNKISRRYYRLVKRNINSKAWQNPRAALDVAQGHVLPDPVTGKLEPISRLGKRRYRRWTRKEPPKRVGRPKKERAY